MNNDEIEFKTNIKTDEDRRKLLEDVYELIPKNITREQRDRYYNILLHTKEFTDTKFPVNGQTKPRVIQLTFIEVEDGLIHVNGYLQVGGENRVVDCFLSSIDDKLNVSTKVYRLKAQSHKEYMSYDHFEIQSGKILHQVEYLEDVNIEKYSEMIDNEIGDLKI